MGCTEDRAQTGARTLEALIIRADRDGDKWDLGGDAGRTSVPRCPPIIPHRSYADGHTDRCAACCPCLSDRSNARRVKLWIHRRLSVDLAMDPRFKIAPESREPEGWGPKDGLPLRAGPKSAWEKCGLADCSLRTDLLDPKAPLGGLNSTPIGPAEAAEAQAKVHRKGT